MRNAQTTLGMVALLAAASGADARSKDKPVWSVTRTTDPITSATSCVVAAYDRAAGMSFTRTGAIYPFVEVSSTHGVIVGVSSGGRFRFPTGDILWRVDDKPFRTLRAAENPTRGIDAGAPKDNSAMNQFVEQQVKMVAAATATSTAAGGELAREMLQEMLNGKGLIYRAAAASVS